MPSNEDLIKQINDVATEKGVDVPVTEGVNNNDLAKMLKELKTPTPPKAPEGDPKAGAQAAADAKAEAKKVKVDKEIKRPPFYIADGKSITSKKGILGPGDEVKAAYLAGGKDAIDKFVKTGHILKG